MKILNAFFLTASAGLVCASLYLLFFMTPSMTGGDVVINLVSLAVGVVGSIHYIDKLLYDHS